MHACTQSWWWRFTHCNPKLNSSNAAILMILQQEWYTAAVTYSSSEHCTCHHLITDAGDHAKQLLLHSLHGATRRVVVWIFTELTNVAAAGVLSGMQTVMQIVVSETPFGERR